NDDIKKVETLKQQQNKAEAEIEKEAEKRKRENQNKTDQTKQDPTKKAEGSNGSSERGIQGADKPCREDPTANPEKCNRNEKAPGCEIFALLKRCRGLNCAPPVAGAPGAGPGQPRRPIIVSTDREIGLQDRNAQTVAATQFYDRLGAELSQIPPEALRASTL